MFKMKYNPNSFIKKYKTKVVVQKFSQIYGINNIKIFALIIKCKLLRIFLDITIILKIIFI